MKAEQLRNLSTEELRAKLESLREDIFRLRFKLRLGQTEVTKAYRESKKDLARVYTILRERQMTK
ncbi:MAG: 50S ribosomal protein L29 [Acidobacteriota bacterium]|nr:50S ribosomal protein L29 [Blastocatellia bacterium]MDW8241011.1 50S ribosomal protein L29 [Acidobacteriota bacterium]